MRLLCHINHYFGPPVGKAEYQSSRQVSDLRRDYVERTAAALRDLGKLPAVREVVVKFCGKAGKSLVPLDLDFKDLEDPRLIIYESLSRMAEQVDDYDYFLNVEDDILVPPDVLENVIAFDAASMVNECLHPNRIEAVNGTRVALDPMLGPRIWTFQEKIFQGHVLRVAVNPHSGLLILSRDKLKYALSQIDPSFRGRVLGDYMESAFAHYHRPFSLYRPYDDLHYHAVIHQDRHHPCWQPKMKRRMADLRRTIHKLRRLRELTFELR